MSALLLQAELEELQIPKLRTDGQLDGSLLFPERRRERSGCRERNLLLLGSTAGCRVLRRAVTCGTGTCVRHGCTLPTAEPWEEIPTQSPECSVPLSLLQK